jgi:hypothetical protein
MMAAMTGRVLIWAGAIAGVLALAGLGGYFVTVGLDKADKLGSVVGALIAVVSLGVSVYGLVQDRRDTQPSTAPNASAQGRRSIAIGGDNTGIASIGDNTRNSQPR